jgi:hypothetical protein
MTNMIAIEILAKLETATERGLSKSQLLGKSKIKARTSVFEDLLTNRKIANIGTVGKPRYVTIENFKPLELAYAALEAKATPGKVVLFLASEFESACVGAVKSAVPEAIKRLIQDRKLIPIKRARSLYYLHAESLRHFVDSPTLASGPEQPQPTGKVDEAAIREAYRRLVSETGFSDVRISDLCRRAGVKADQIKSWLLAQSRQGIISPTRGDWSLAGPDERAAAIEINGEQHLRIRFL